MKTKLILLAVLFVSNFQSFNSLAGEYEEAMNKGIEMLNQANDNQSATEAANYFERVSESAKNEWLPLYYAAYASLKTGFYQDKPELKDTWYLKGISLSERASAIAKNESEIYALEAYLRLMYISNDPMKRAEEHTGLAIGLLEKSKALDPTNPRPWFIQGQNTLYTPEFFGGGSEKARPIIEKANELFATFKPVNSLMPDWGKPQCDKLMAKVSEEKK